MKQFFQAMDMKLPDGSLRTEFELLLLTIKQGK